MNRFYRRLYPVFRALMRVFLPWKVVGDCTIPEGGVLLCANHCSNLDPLYLLAVAGQGRQLRIMGKAELFRIPVLRWLLRKVDMIPVKRGLSDVSAYKESLRALKEGGQLLIFPEGTRVKPGQTIPGHTGAAMIALRAGVPLLPVFLERRKRLFHPTRLVFGEAYMPEIAGRKPTPEESRAITDDLMRRIYSLEERL